MPVGAFTPGCVIPVVVVSTLVTPGCVIPSAFDSVLNNSEGVSRVKIVNAVKRTFFNYITSSKL